METDVKPWQWYKYATDIEIFYKNNHQEKVSKKILPIYA